MVSRLKLDSILREILGTGNVYYQPPESIKLNYPCIVYELSGSENEYADNTKYIKYKRYKITYIDRNPDSLTPDKIEDLSLCELAQSFKSDGMNHWVYNISIPNIKQEVNE